MPNDRTRSGDPASDIPEAAGAYRPPFPQQEPGTLAGRLVNVVDTCRNIKAMLGVSIYRVFLAHGYWTGAGGRRGRGAGKPVITSRVEIVPIPACGISTPCGALPTRWAPLRRATSSSTRSRPDTPRTT